LSLSPKRNPTVRTPQILLRPLEKEEKQK